MVQTVANPTLKFAKIAHTILVGGNIRTTENNILTIRDILKFAFPGQF